MRKTKEVLRLKFELGLGLRQIARSCSWAVNATPSPTTGGTDYATTCTQTWNFNVQHKFGHSIAAEVAYVGNKGTRLQTSSEYSIPLPGPGNVQARRLRIRSGACSITKSGADTAPITACKPSSKSASRMASQSWALTLSRSAWPRPRAKRVGLRTTISPISTRAAATTMCPTTSSPDTSGNCPSDAAATSYPTRAAS